MKDILDQEIKIGDLIAYTTIIGRSANPGLYEVRGFTDNGKMRCHPITKSYGFGNDHDINVPGIGTILSRKALYDPRLGKARLKTTLLSMGERCIILNGDSAVIIKEIAVGTDSYAR